MFEVIWVSSRKLDTYSNLEISYCRFRGETQSRQNLG